MLTVTPLHFLILAFVLFGIGFLGLLIRRNILLMLMSLELMLNGINVALVTFSRVGNNLDGGIFTRATLIPFSINLALVTFSRVGNNLDGGIFVFFIMTVAASEVAVGLALLVALYKKRKSVFTDDMALLKN